MRRLTTKEVCALGRFSRATLWRRVHDGRLPRPIDHARQALFDEAAVIAALVETTPRWVSSTLRVDRQRAVMSTVPVRSQKRWLA